MIKVLQEIESKLSSLLVENELHSMYIDYHKPFVSRIWFQYGDYRVYLHKIESCGDNKEALFHPHPWKSAIRLIRGKYEMGIGHSETNDIPNTDCKLILSEGTVYEMTEENGWHYVNPLSVSYSIMVTGERSNRKMPVEPKKDFRKLNSIEVYDILNVVSNYYKLDLKFEELVK